MSDLGGPSNPQKLTPIQNRQPAPAEQTNRTHRRDQGSNADPRNQNNPTDHDKAAEQSQRFRDPAVSIDATTAHIHKGDTITPTVSHVDGEGRPIVDTDKAKFALRPDAGLKSGDQIALEIIRADAKVEANLISLNQKPIDPPIPLTMTVIAAHNTEPHNIYPAAKVLAPLPQEHKEPLPLSKTNMQPIAVSSKAIEEASKENIANFLSVLPNVNSSTIHVDSVKDPTVLKTSTEDLKAMLNLQAEITSSQKMTLLSNLNIMPKPQSAQSFQVLNLNDNARPVQLSLMAKAAPNAEKIIAQVPVAEKTLQQFGMAQQSRRHPVYEIQTQTSHYLAALPQMMDLRGHTVSVQPLIPQHKTPEQTTNTASSNATGQLGTKGTQLHGTITQASGAMIKATITVTPITVEGNQVNAYTSPSKGLMTAQSNQTSVQNSQATIQAVSASAGKPTPTGTLVRYDIQTDQGRITAPVNWPIKDAALPIPFKAGDQIPIQLLTTAGIAGTAGTTTPDAAAAAQTIHPKSSDPSLTIPPAPLQTTSGWPVMNDMHAIAQMTDPVMADQVSALTAGNGDNLMAGLTYMLAANAAVTQQGVNTNELLPQQLAKALAGQPDGNNFIDLMIKDIISATSALTQEPATLGEWRAMVIPTEPRDPNLSLFAFMFREPEQDNPLYGSDDEDGEEAGTPRKEFIIEVDFSEFGPIQVYGQLYPKRLNIMINSQLALPNQLCTEIENLYKSAILEDNFKGRITFNTAKNFNIEVKDYLTLSS